MTVSKSWTLASKSWTLALASMTSMLVGIFALPAPPAAADDSRPAPTDWSQYTTENTIVQPPPDGSYKLITNREAVRAKKNGVWAPIDTSLGRSGGSLKPGNTAVDLSFPSLVPGIYSASPTSTRQSA